jgi:hypothetical protein
MGRKVAFPVDYISEVALQAGSWAGDRIGSWMGHWVLGETLADAVHKPRLFVEYSRASADATVKDGYHGTFDPLFPSSHDKYGLTDLFCSSNSVHFRAGFQHDGLCVSNKLAIASTKVPGGTHIGQEADLQAQWAAARTTLLTVAYGRLFADEFLQKSASGVPYNIFILSVGQTF